MRMASLSGIWAVLGAEVRSGLVLGCTLDGARRQAGQAGQAELYNFFLHTSLHHTPSAAMA